MLAQHSVKRMLAFSTVASAGFIVLGVTLAGPYGLAGALRGSRRRRAVDGPAVHVRLPPPRRDGDGHAWRRARWPRAIRWRGRASSAARSRRSACRSRRASPGHWRIYVAANGAGWFPLAVLVVATILSVLAYVRVIALVWWGETPGDRAGDRAQRSWRTIWTSERLPLVAAIVVLMVVIVVAGLVPANPLGGCADERPRQSRAHGPAQITVAVPPQRG